MSQCCWVKPGAIWACALLLKSHARHKMCCNLPALAQGFSAVLVKCAHSHAAWMRAPESCSAEKLLLLLSSVSSLKTSPVLICLCLVWCQEEEDCFWLCWYLVVVELVSFLNSACVKQPITRVSGHPGQWSSCPLRAGSVFRLKMSLYQAAYLILQCLSLPDTWAHPSANTESGKKNRGRRVPKHRGGAVLFVYCSFCNVLPSLSWGHEMFLFQQCHSVKKHKTTESCCNIICWWKSCECFERP